MYLPNPVDIAITLVRYMITNLYNHASSKIFQCRKIVQKKKYLFPFLLFESDMGISTEQVQNTILLMQKYKYTLKAKCFYCSNDLSGL